MCLLIFVNKMNHKSRLIVSLSPYLKEKVVDISKKYGCSQAEILRMGLIRLMEEEK